MQPVQPRDESDHDEDLELHTNSSPADDASDLDSEADAKSNDSRSSVASQGETGTDDLKDISFGALAEAQARLNPNPRKRKRPDLRDAPLEDSNDDVRPARRQNVSKEENFQDLSRTSKHAPAIMSSRNPVSRKREVFSPPPVLKSRDPRFDAAIVADGRRGNTSSTQRAAKNYAFLSDYQANEVLDLKSQLKKTKDPDQQAQLKRQIMSIEAKLRNAQTDQREAEILQEHKRKERQAIKEGRKAKPYYLKPSEVKKQIIQERQDAMGKRARDKAEKRKKKREKTKEARDMPRTRRFVD